MTSTTKSKARSAPVRAPAPRQVRIPAPERFLNLVRLLSLLLVILALTDPWWLPRLEAWLPTQPMLDRWLAARPWVLPTVLYLANRLAILVLGIYGMVLAVMALSLMLQVLRPRRARGTVVRITLPPPHSPQATPEGTGVDLWTSIFRFMENRGRLRGAAARFAFGLHGLPAQPVELHVWVPTRKGGLDGRWPTALRKLISGMTPDALLEQIPDPLATAAPGTVTLWRDYRLKVSSAYPLRLPSDLLGTDLLGPLASGLRPRAASIQWLRLEVIVQPVKGVFFVRDWHGRAMRLLMRAQAKAEYSLADDVKGLEAKLDGVAYETTIRVIGQGTDPKALQGELGDVRLILRQYHARTLAQRQELVLARRGRVRAVWSARWSAGLLLALSGATVVGLPRLVALVPASAPWAAGLPWATGLAAGALVGSCWSLLRGGRRRQQLGTLIGRAMLPAPPPRGLLPFAPLRPPSILGALELDGLWHLPPSVEGIHLAMQPNRIMLPPAIAFTNDEPLRIALGYGRRPDGSEAHVGPHLRNLRQVFHAVGGMGARKTQLAANICQQLLPHGLLLLDGKGGDAGNLTMNVRHLLTLEQEKKLVLIDLLDASWPVGLNPLWMPPTETKDSAATDQVVGQVLAMFGKLDPKTWPSAAGMKDMTKMALFLVLQAEQRPTLSHVRQVFLDPDYRTKLLVNCTNTEVREFWQVTYAAMGEGHKVSRDALFRRFNDLLLPELIRHIVCQPLPTVNLTEVIEQKQILLCPMADNKLGDLARATGMLVVSSIVKAAFERQGNAQSRHDVALVIDELQVFLNEFDNSDMRTALSRLRSLGIPQIYLNQALGQLHDVEELLLINTGNRTIFQTQDPDASQLAKAYGLDPADVKNQQPAQHQYVDFRVQVTDFEDRRTGPMSVRPLPWPEPVALPELTYTRPERWEDVRADEARGRSRALDKARAELERQYAADPLAALATAARMPEAVWVALTDRNKAHRTAQRDFILEYPGCIPERLERQTWLSRLAHTRPVFEAAAEYARARREVPAEGEAAGKTQHPGMQTPGGSRSEGSATAPAAGDAPPPEALAPAPPTPLPNPQKVGASLSHQPMPSTHAVVLSEAGDVAGKQVPVEDLEPQIDL